MATVALTTPEARQAGSRSRLYALLGEGFRFPSAALHRNARGGEFLAEVQAAGAELPYPLAVPGPLGQGMDLSLEAFEQEYIGLFDVGGPRGAPSFLYEGEYGGGRLKVLEEVLRYYHYFGLQLAQEDGKRDRPDHLATELSFLHALTFKEAGLLAAGKDPSAYRQAERDFVAVHAGDLLSQVSARVGPRGAPFYSDLAQLGHGFCQAELAHLANR